MDRSGAGLMAGWLRGRKSRALERSRADIAVSVTGVAGPAGGTAAKPVGLVWLAWGTRGGVVDAVSYRFPGDRAAIREATVAMALAGLLERAGPG